MLHTSAKWHEINLLQKHTLYGKTKPNLDVRLSLAIKIIKKSYLWFKDL